MLYRPFVAAALSAALLSSCFLSSRAVQRASAAVVAPVLQNDVDAAKRVWKEKEAFFGALMLHDEMDEVDRLLDRISAEDTSSVDYLLDRAELLGQLKHLSELNLPTLKNIF